MSKLEKLPIAQIDFGTRGRKDYKDITGLLASIREHGQIQPIAVIEKSSMEEQPPEDHEDFDPSKPYMLLAGGRRLKAHIEGKLETIDAKIYDDNRDQIEIRKIELYENLDREDLEWSEEVRMKAEIHELEKETYGEMEGAGRGKKGQSIRDTARTLNVSHGGLSQDIELAKAMEAIPSLKKHKKKSDARKELRQMKKMIEDHDTVNRIKKENEGKDEKTILKKLASQYHNKPDMEGFKDFETGTVDFVELDPPLQIGFEDIERYDHASYGEVSGNDYLDFMATRLKEAYRVMKDHSWILVWYPIEPWHQPLLELMQDTGFKTRGIPMMWDKTRGQTRAANYNLGNAYEVAFYGRKGEPILESPGHKNILTYKPADKSKRFHPTEKPIELYENILQIFTRKGAVCVSGFAGSGNIILAGANVTRTVHAFDISPDFKNKFDLKVYDSVPGQYSSYRSKQ